MERIHIHAPSLVLGGVAGAAAGGVLGYLLCRRSARAEIDREVQSVKEHYNKLAAESQRTVEQVVADAEATVETAVGTLSRLHDGNPDLEGLDEDDEDSVWPGDADESAAELGILTDEENLVRVPDMPQRNASKPYVISMDEFLEREEFGKLTITYYAGDKVLVDDKDQPIRDINGTTGKLDPLGFGGISGDPHIRYIRNEKLELDFEIVLDGRSYAEAILNYGNPNRGGIRE